MPIAPRRLLPLVAISMAAGCVSAPRQEAGVDDQEAGVAVYVGDVMVRGYHPEPTLVVDETPVPAARFEAVDVHCHWELDADPQAMLAAMDARNVRAAVNLSGGWGERLEAMLDRFHAVAPDRLIIFCNVDFDRIDEPDFGATASRALRDAHARGARGLKIFKNLGLTIRDASGAVVPVDDPRLDPVWATCAELDMPVLIHTADPVAFFAPIDERNERWMQLQRHPDWSFHGPEFPDRTTLFAQRDRMMSRHRDTTFICAHLASRAEDLAALGDWLDRNPNAVVDISGRVAELGRRPYTARRFFMEHSSRILFGTDRFPGRPSQPRYRNYYRFLETADEFFDYYDHAFPPTGEWRIYGVFLPDDVLRAVYHENADRIFGVRR